MEQNTPKKRISAGVVILIILLALLVIAAGAYCGLCKWVQDNGRLLPGASASDSTGVMELDLDLSKLDRDQAVDRLTAHMDDRLGERTLTLHYGDGQTATLTGSLLSFDPVSAVDYAMEVKGSQPFLKLGALWLEMTQRPVDLALSASTLTPEGELQIQQLIETLTRELYRAPVDYTYEVDEENLQVLVTFGTEGQKIAAEGLFEQIRAALVVGQAQLDVDTHSIPCEQPTGQALSALTFVEPMPPQPQEDGALSPMTYGRRLDPVEAQMALDSHASVGEPCVLTLTKLIPEITNDEEFDYLFEDLLATVTSSMDGVEARSFNVRRAADFCNEYIMLPGDVFSYIGAIGDPGVANGYQISTGYYRGETVPMEGGGVCQVSSSIYYCAVYADLEIVHRAAHAFTVGYVPNGLDATMYYPTLDFKFRNNTDYPIKIVTSYTPGAWGKLTVSIYGYKANDNYIKTEINTLSTTPWTTVYQPDETIPLGTTQVKITPYTGYTVEVWRLRYSGDGTLLEREYENFSRYAKRDKVILFNPADAASLGLNPDGTPIVVPEPVPGDPNYTPGW